MILLPAAFIWCLHVIHMIHDSLLSFRFRSWYMKVKWSKGDQRVKTGEKRVRTVGSTNSVDCTHGYLASFPGSSPAFCCILYCMRQKAGEEPGNKAMDTIFNMQYTNSSSPPWTYYWHLISKLSLCCPSWLESAPTKFLNTQYTPRYHLM